MQDSGDCFIFHDQTEHVQEVDTILFLDESMQDSGDCFTPHNQIVHVHEDNTMQIPTIVHTTQETVSFRMMRLSVCKRLIPYCSLMTVCMSPETVLYRSTYIRMIQAKATAYFKPATCPIPHPLILIKTFEHVM